MNYKVVLVVFSFLLSGCSLWSDNDVDEPIMITAPEVQATTNQAESSSLTYKLTATHLGNIALKGKIDRQILEQSLDGSYRIRSGMAALNQQNYKYYVAQKKSEDNLFFRLDSQSYIEKIKISDAGIITQDKMTIGSPFSALYKKAFKSCQMVEYSSDKIKCVSPSSSHISYIFSGVWNGPSSLMPSDDALRNWVVKEIIWSAQ